MSNPTRSICSASLSNVGKVRSVNEDACLEMLQRGIWAVADGMGGHGFGDVASASVVEALSSFSISSGAGVADGVARIQALLARANESLRGEAHRRGKRVIGSTVVVLLVPSEKSAADGEGAVVWAGDSRAYRYRDGLLQLLTRDHSYVEELVAVGALTAEQAQGHPQGNIITRAVGANDTLETSWRKVSLRSGDRFLLCSDGLTRELSEEVIAEVMRGPDSEHAAQALVDGALAGGGNDNITVVVVDVDSPSG